MRRQQLLAQLLENRRHSRWLSISLRLGLRARSLLVEYQWSWERWGISLELHGRTWSITRRELGPRSQRLPLVTHYTVMDSNPAARKCNPPKSAPSHRAGLEPGMLAREAGTLPRRLKALLAYICYTRSPCSSQHISRAGPSEVCQRPSGWSRGGMVEGHVVKWEQNLNFWYKLHSPCLEE